MPVGAKVAPMNVSFFSVENTESNLTKEAVSENLAMDTHQFVIESSSKENKHITLTNRGDFVTKEAANRKKERKKGQGYTQSSGRIKRPFSNVV